MFKIAENKIYVEDESGKEVAYIHFETTEDGILIADKTFVDDSLRGQGIAAKLVTGLVEYARRNNKKIQPSCSYIIQTFEKNPSYHDVLAQTQ